MSGIRTMISVAMVRNNVSFSGLDRLLCCLNVGWLPYQQHWCGQTREQTTWFPLVIPSPKKTTWQTSSQSKPISWYKLDLCDLSWNHYTYFQSKWRKCKLEVLCSQSPRSNRSTGYWEGGLIRLKRQFNDLCSFCFNEWKTNEVHTTFQTRLKQ